MKKIKYLLVLLLVVLITGCSSETAFLDNYKINLSKKDDIFEIPSYSYSKNNNSETEVIEGVEFVQQNLTYKLRDWNYTKNEDKNYITFSCDMDGYIEFYYNTNIPWKYSFMYYTPKVFDYYTGELYRSSELSPNNSVTITSKLSDDTDQIKYTDIKFDGNTYKIGMAKESDFHGYGESLIHEYVDGRWHNKKPVSVTVTYTIEVPENYDGVMIALEKSGITKEGFDEIINKDIKIKELEKQKNETGKESDELKKIKEEQNKVTKIKLNKDNLNNYYFLSTKQIFDIKKPEKTNYLPLIICIIGGVLIIIIITIFIIKKKKNKKKVVKIEEPKKEEPVVEEKKPASTKKTSTKKTTAKKTTTKKTTSKKTTTKTNKKSTP